MADLERRPRGETAWSLRADDGGEVAFLRELGEHSGRTRGVLIHQYADPLVKRASIQDEAAYGCLKSNWATARHLARGFNSPALIHQGQSELIHHQLYRSIRRDLRLRSRMRGHYRSDPKKRC